MKDQSEPIKERLSQVWNKDQWLQSANAITRKRAGAGNLWASPDGIEPRKELLYLSVGIPDSDELPRAELNEAMKDVMHRNDDTSLRYGFGPGYYPVRKYLAETYSRERGFAVTPDWFMLFNGSSGAIDQIARCLVDPGEVILCETPTYMGSLANFYGVGAEVCPVTMDQDGLSISDLKQKVQALKGQGKTIKLLYTISTFHNPTGTALNTQRKMALLDLAEREKFVILDDDAYGDLYYEARPSDTLSSLSGGHGVLTVGTFSKVLATGIRIGWIHAHPDAINLFTRMKFDMGQNQMALHMMGRFLEKGHLESHVEKMRVLYKKKMILAADFLSENLSDHIEFNRPSGGFYLWVKLKPGLSARSVWRTATQEGVAVNQGYTFIPDYRQGDGEYIRIAFSWTPMYQLEEALDRLKTAILRVVNGKAA
ncbi:MAG: PLP-dependent aminotransferase family protein [Proteobacteria bacterium]|nr:PLP-dependent aminotransferase family protein [Pseudomonadota bacterium]MBU4469720.1 PLP-dependent aminotransferase family protein [Pseudomonadota bacterium]MCG2751801.1 PLP-dependent aminotransferase family protein [Desulfobacteraceae bacterium]